MLCQNQWDCKGSGYKGSGYKGSGYKGSGYKGSGYKGSGYKCTRFNIARLIFGYDNRMYAAYLLSEKHWSFSA